MAQDDTNQVSEQRFNYMVLQLMMQAKRLYCLEAELTKHREYVHGLEIDLQHAIDQLQRLQR